MTIEEYVISYLSAESALSGIPVSGSVPHPMPEKFVTVEQTGSSMIDHIVSATIAVQSWAGTRAESADLNETVKSLLDAMVQEAEISKSALDSDYNYPDLETNHPRYQAVYNIVYFL